MTFKATYGFSFKQFRREVRGAMRVNAFRPAYTVRDAILEVMADNRMC